MKKNLLFERQEADIEMVDERINEQGKKETALVVKWQHADIINKNNRVYRREILQREMKKVSQRIKNGDTVWGEGFHPTDPFGKLRDVTHRWDKIWMEDNGVCKGIITLAETQAGKDIKALIKAGKVGLSSRGTGTVTEKTKKVDGKDVKFLDVNDDYHLETPGDFVVAPSVPGAGTLDESFCLYESQLKEAEEDEKKVEDRKMITNDTVIEAYVKARSEGLFKGTFVEFKKLHPELLPEEENPVKKSIKESKEEKAKKKKRVTAGEVYEQARKAGMSPDEYARILNENLEKEESSGKERRIMDEAKLASYNSSALAPFVPKDPKRTERSPDKKVRLSPLAPRNLHIKEEAEPEEPKHKFKTREQIIEASKKPLHPETQARIKIMEKSDALRDEALRRERSLAGPPRKLSLERRIEILTEKLNDLVSRFDKALGENEE